MNILELVLPLVGVLIGVALGPIFSDRQERKRWHRQKQYEVTRAVTSAARTVLWKFNEVASGLDDVDLEEKREAFWKAMFAFRESFADVKLLFDGPVVKAAEDLEDQLGNILSPHIENLSMKADDLTEKVNEARSRMTKFQDTAREVILQKFSLRRWLGALSARRK